jgi:hypothetical protein
MPVGSPLPRRRKVEPILASTVEHVSCRRNGENVVFRCPPPSRTDDGRVLFLVLLRLFRHCFVATAVMMTCPASCTRPSHISNHNHNNKDNTEDSITRYIEDRRTVESYKTKTKRHSNNNSYHSTRQSLSPL